jgi:hypothetical protein
VSVTLFMQAKSLPSVFVLSFRGRLIMYKMGMFLECRRANEKLFLWVCSLGLAS